MTNSELLQDISDYIERQRCQLSIPGLAAAIVRDGEKIWSRGFGYRTQKEDAEVTPQTLLAIGSSTKSFTATAVAMLVEDGELDWDEPVHNYLPDFRLHDSFAGERLTLRDMACHRSGLPRYDFSLFNPELDRKDFVDCVQHLKANQDFRTTWQYQNHMYTAMGYVIEQVIGSTWESFTSERILGPLGMKHSNFCLADSRRSDNYAAPHGRRDEKIVELPWVEIGATGPAGSINSTVDEMANWLLLNLNEGEFNGDRLLSAGSLGQLQSPQMVMPQDSRHPEIRFRSYGLGWFIESYRGSPRVHHGGNTVGFTSSVSFMPEEGLGVVVLSNMSQDWLPDAISCYIYDRFLGVEPADWSERIHKSVQSAKESMKKGMEHLRQSAKVDTEPSHKLQDYAGRYEHPGLDTLSVEVDDDSLKAQYGLLHIDLHHHHYDTFAAEIDLWFDKYTVLVGFETDRYDGSIVSFSIPFGFEEGVEPAVFNRVPEKVCVSEEVLRGYAGEYELESAEATFTVSHRGEGLVVTVPGQRPVEVHPVSDTKFEAEDVPGFSLEFKLEEKRISEVVVTQPGAVFTARPRQ